MTGAATLSRVLITGAAGGIGRELRSGLAGRYGVLRLSDRAPMGEARAGEEIVQAELEDIDQVLAATRDCEAIVHLGGIPEEASWEDIHAANLVGTYNLYEAARRNRVRRVVFASSNHVVGFYRRTRKVSIHEPMRPDTRYGLSKACGEMIARLYADKWGIESVCLRIGSFRPKPLDARMLSTWISPRDTVQLVARALETPGLHHEVVYGVSNNDRSWWNNPAAPTIGFQPEDNAEDYAKEFEGYRPKPGDPGELFHGGSFCSVEFAGDTDAID
jgi:uronate dehydrogenase